MVIATSQPITSPRGVRSSDARDAKYVKEEVAAEATSSPYEAETEAAVEVTDMENESDLPDLQQAAFELSSLFDKVATEVASMPDEASGERRYLQGNDNGSDSYEGGRCRPADGGTRVRYTPPNDYTGLDSCVYLAEDQDGRIGGATITFIVTDE